MVETILQNAFFTELVLPFLLVFAIVFAVLQKSEVLGKGKKQADAIVALVSGLLVVSFGYAVHIITYLIPFLAVGLVVILVFLLLWGMFYKEAFEANKGVKIAAGIVSLVAVVIAVLYFTGAWDKIMPLLSGTSSSALASNVILVIVIVGAIAMALGFGGKSEKKE